MLKVLNLALLLTLLHLTAFGQHVFNASAGKISFFSKAPLEDITATNSNVGAIYNSSTGRFLAKAKITDFNFPNKTMQEHFNDNYMQSDKFPFAEFKGNVAEYQQINPKKNGLSQVSVTGDLTIHGVTKSYTMQGTMEVKDGKIVVSATFMVALADHDIKVPQLVMQKIAEKIEVKVNFTLAPSDAK